jgi:hypothetical protein
MDFEKLGLEFWTFFEENKKFLMWIIISTVLFIVLIPLFRKIRDNQLLKTVTKQNRGTKTEKDLVLRLLKHKIPAQTIFHDLYVKKNNGEFSQIDLVVATKVGIVVFEVKDFSGWIFGNGHQANWTTVLAYGKRKYRFYNPIMQNNKHIEVLRNQLKQFENIPFYSIIVFYGDCILKDVSFVPNETFLVKSNRVFEVLEIIMKNNEPAKYTNKKEVVQVFKEAVNNGESMETQIQHIENIEDMMGKERISN